MVDSSRSMDIEAHHRSPGRWSAHLYCGLAEFAQALQGAGDLLPGEEVCGFKVMVALVPRPSTTCRRRLRSFCQAWGPVPSVAYGGPGYEEEHLVVVGVGAQPALVQVQKNGLASHPGEPKHRRVITARSPVSQPRGSRRQTRSTGAASTIPSVSPCHQCKKVPGVYAFIIDRLLRWRSPRLRQRAGSRQRHVSSAEF